MPDDISGLQLPVEMRSFEYLDTMILRQSVERILIDKTGRSVIVKIKTVPASRIQKVEELARELDPADAVAEQ